MAIEGSACNPMMVAIEITLLLLLPVGRCHSVVVLAAAEDDVVKTIVPYSIVGRYVMQTVCWEMPWVRALRVVSLMLAVMLGLEWTVPLGGYAQLNQGPAQPNQEPASAPAAKVANQDPQPMPETESAEAQSPVYKKWWFWVLVVVGVGVGFLVAVIAIAADEGGLGYQPVGGIGPASP